MNLRFLLRCCVTVLPFCTAWSSYAASNLPAVQQQALIFGETFESNEQRFRVVQNLGASIDTAKVHSSNKQSPSAIVPQLQQLPAEQSLSDSTNKNQAIVAHKGNYAIRLRNDSANLSSTAQLAAQSIDLHTAEHPVVQNMGTKVLGIVTGVISFSYKQGASSEAIASSHQLSLSYSLDQAQLGFVQLPPEMSRILHAYRALQADSLVERVSIDIIEHPLTPH